MKTISEHYGTGQYANRKAIVVVDDKDILGVKYIIDEDCELRYFLDRAVRYAEDAAENWCTGIVNPVDLIPHDY